MSYIKKEKIDEIKEKSDIVSIVSDYVSIKKSGRYYTGNCPFHNEKTPSFFIYPDTNTFHCFGCGKHGDNISFLMELESLDYLSALNRLAEKFGIELEYNNAFNNFNKKDVEKYYLVNEFAAKFYYRKMMENSIPKKYLKNRGITQKTINIFLIGYADENWKSLYNELISKNVDIKIAEKLGLIIKTKKGDYIDRFRNRIIFPIFDKDKKIIGFGGRTTVNDNAKYLNSPESIIFKKGDNVYGIDKIVENNIRDKILIVEGYMDVISLYQSGINYVVAGLGTALTENQAILVKRFSRNNVYLCYDADNAGIKATNKANSTFNEISVKPNIILLPDTLDPDDYIKKYGLDNFNKLVEKPYDIYGFNYENLKNNKKLSNSITENTIFYETILEFLSKIDTSILRDLYISKISNDFGFDKNSIKEDFNKFGNKNLIKKIDLKESQLDYKFKESLLNSDKKVLIMGIILMMRCEKGVFNIINNLKKFSKYSNLYDIFCYIEENTKNHIVTLPNMLINKFKNSSENLRIIDYIMKFYSEKAKLSILDYIKILDLTIINFEIRKVTRNIEELKKMDKDNADVILNLNFNIGKLVELNKKLKSVEKGVHRE